MKKIISMLLAFAMCLALCACGGNSSDSTTASEPGAAPEIQTPTPVETITPTVEPTPEATEVVCNLGDTVSTEYMTLTLDGISFGETELLSSTDASGRYHYYSSETGNPFFCVTGSFKNTAGIPIDLWDVYVQFCFDGKYNYAGSMDGMVPGDFMHDISPLVSVDCCFYTEVPQELLDIYKSCELKIGFREDFGIKVNSNGLPAFDYCDDIFTFVAER